MRSIVFVPLFWVTRLFAIEVAVTVDDLPLHAPTLPHVSRLEIARKMLAAFEKTEVPKAYGFINALKVKEDPGLISVLNEWTKAGHPLGNHTFSHPNLNDVSFDNYLEDIKANEPLLETLMGKQFFRYFRFPFLVEGNTDAKRNGVRRLLTDNGYQVAQVTIDFEDWAWNAAYVRCTEKRDQKAVRWLRKTYYESGMNALETAKRLSDLSVGREIKHVLLLHVGIFDAEMAEKLLKGYKKSDVKFIALPEALSDPIYQTDPRVLMDHGQTFLDQLMISKKIPFPKDLKWPPLERVKKICGGNKK